MTNSIADGVTFVVATPPILSVELVGALIPVLVPLLIAAGKLLLPRIPTWALPILATLLGVAVNEALTYANGAGVNRWLALALGASGTGLREIVDQLKQQASAKISLLP
jgi:hypothetical protein